MIHVLIGMFLYYCGPVIVKGVIFHEKLERCSTRGNGIDWVFQTAFWAKT